ncbi:unnamed protein product [Macrosiphum euphorbiae]|uniref:Uncharacterized protein n=1 Tax=Macrosiphum euphorbiae TaxID=13131 RepID=A0AAV0W4G1_9HEMI|nr:unnamed protein product [Macrosiphum euphorbiae]
MQYQPVKSHTSEQASRKKDSPTYKVFDYKWQIYIKAKDVNKISSSILIKHENINHRLFFTDDYLTCHRCKKTGHTSSNYTENIDKCIPFVNPNVNQIEALKANEKQNTSKNPNQEENPEINCTRETHLINPTDNRETVYTDISISEDPSESTSNSTEIMTLEINEEDNERATEISQTHGDLVIKKGGQVGIALLYSR